VFEVYERAGIPSGRSALCSPVWCSSPALLGKKAEKTCLVRDLHPLAVFEDVLALGSQAQRGL
jgi:hypothetical protein